MAEPRTPDAELSDGLASNGHDPDQPALEVGDDELAAALAAVFGLSEETPDDHSASEWAPSPVVASAAPLPLAPQEEVAATAEPDLLSAARSKESEAEPGLADDGWSWWDAESAVQERSPSSDPDGSTTALKEAGFAGPLHSALGELGRIIPERTALTSTPTDRNDLPGATAPRAAWTENPQSHGRRPAWLSASGLRQAWLARRDWGPGLMVAAVVVVAFVVVLAVGAGDRTTSRVSTRPTTSISSPSTTAEVPTVPFAEVPPEPLADPGVAATDGASPTVGVARTSPPRRAARAPAGSPPVTQARTRSSGAPAPAPPPAPANPAPPAGNPSPGTPPPTQVTAPPRTTVVPDDSRPPASDDLCAELREPQRSICEEAVNRS